MDYITKSCMNHYQDKFDENCYELETLRWFKETCVSKEESNYYDKVSPIISSEIDKLDTSGKMYDFIYNSIVSPSVEDVCKGKFRTTYNRCKYSFDSLENEFVRPKVEKDLTTVLKLTLNKKKK